MALALLPYSELVITMLMTGLIFWVLVNTWVSLVNGLILGMILGSISTFIPIQKITTNRRSWKSFGLMLLLVLPFGLIETLLIAQQGLFAFSFLLVITNWPTVAHMLHFYIGVALVFHQTLLF